MIKLLQKEDLEIFEFFLKNNENEFLNLSNYLKYYQDDFYKLSLFIKCDEVVGCVLYWKLLENLEIDYILIDKNNRNNGYAQLLLEQLLSEYKNKTKYIRLEVSSNNTAAISFYRKNKFKELRIRKNYYKNGADAIEMVKEIQ